MGKMLKEIGHLLAHLLLNGGKVNILELYALINFIHIILVMYITNTKYLNNILEAAFRVWSTVILLIPFYNGITHS